MSVAERTLLVVNRTAGAGHGRATVDRLRAMLAELPTALRVETVRDHPEARACANDFLAASDAPAAVVAGGGSGTLRAVIEGLCEGRAELPGRERVRLGALRMGSGNPLARQFGVPKDPERALRGVIENLRAGRTAPCCVMRFEVGEPDGPPSVRYAATMAGFGQFGRAPGDLERWHGRVPGPRKVAAKLLGVERVNNAEYVLALLIRFARHTLSGDSEKVEILADGRREVMPLLAGVVMNFPFGEMPVDPGVRVEDEAVAMYMIPATGRISSLRTVLAPRRALGRAMRINIRKPERVEIRLLDRDRAKFFLDEDPMVFYGSLTMEVAGSLAFAPGPEYSFPTNKGDFV